MITSGTSYPVVRERGAGEAPVAPGLEVSGLVKRYGQVLALDGCSLRVPPGHLMGLLGPNGAGKTTVMRTLFGLVVPVGWLTAAGLPARLVGHDGEARCVGGWPEQDGGQIEVPPRSWVYAGTGPRGGA